MSKELKTNLITAYLHDHRKLPWIRLDYNKIGIIYGLSKVLNKEYICCEALGFFSVDWDGLVELGDSFVIAVVPDDSPSSFNPTAMVFSKEEMFEGVLLVKGFPRPSVAISWKDGDL